MKAARLIERRRTTTNDNYIIIVGPSAARQTVFHSTLEGNLLALELELELAPEEWAF